MRYRNFGSLDFQVSVLGFGCMRLPCLDGVASGPGIDEEEAVRMIRYAIEQGVNYVDTAYLYHGGNSELVLGKALRDGYRDRVKVATKAPMMRITKAQEYDAVLDEQLQKLGVEMIDFYLFHGLNKQTWEVVKNQELLARAEAAKKAGKIGHIGFSFHDPYEVFADIIEGYEGWEFCQIQYNYMDTEFQAGQKGLRLAASRGMGVVVMEPLQGGKLVNPPAEIKEIIRESGYAGSLADLALKWLISQPEWSVFLSGMTAMKEVRENIEAASTFTEGTLSGEEARLIDAVKVAYRERNKDCLPCSGCNYCLPCPHSVDIPANIRFYNDGILYGYFNEAKRRYGFLLKPEQRAGACLECGRCDEVCPQKIPISEWMPKIHAALTS